MSFAAALGLGSSLIGGIFGSSKAKREAALLAEQNALLRDQQNFNNYLAVISNDERAENNDYLRSIEQLNRLLSGQERDFDIDQMYQYQELLAGEREFEIERLMEMDREAARVQELRLTQLLRNQDIYEDERRFAEEQLQLAQSTARGERDEDMRRFHEERLVADQNRQFLMAQFAQSQDALRSDQARDLALRERITGQINGIQSALRMASTELGDMPTLETLTQEDLDAEIERRSSQYQSDVDRAADRVASVNEANLIRAGIDSSTPGIARRGDITRRIADEYQSARNRAYDEALAFITGRQALNNSNYTTELQGRQDKLSEVLGIESAGLAELMGMPNVTSTAGLIEAANLAATPAYTRQIESANDYRNPVSMGTAVYDAISPAMRMTSGMPRTSAATFNASQLGSSVYDPARQTLLDTGTFASLASQIGQQGVSNAAASSRAADSFANDAWSNFGRNLNDWAVDFGDDFWSNLTGKSSKPSADLMAQVQAAVSG